MMRASHLLGIAIAARSLVPGMSHADGTLDEPTSVTPLGSYGGIVYVRYEGTFRGRTQDPATGGSYFVPYRLEVPTSQDQTNRTVIVEPPHFVGGPATVSDSFVGRGFFFSRGFAHAAVGYGITDLFGQGFGSDQTILVTGRDCVTHPGDGCFFIDGGVDADGAGGHMDIQIVVDFARALVSDPVAVSILGTTDRRYVTGFSQSSQVVLDILDHGWAEGVFDLAFPFIADDYTNPQDVVARGAYSGKIVIVGSEGGEDSFGLIDRGDAPDQYRYWGVAGTTHVGDSLFRADPGNGAAMTTPASYLPELRAHFLQADRWVRHDGPPPPPSANVRVGPYDFVRDANGNAYTFETRSKRNKHVARLPMLELGEARFHAVFDDSSVGSFPQGGFTGTYDGGDPETPIPSIGELRDSSGRPFGFRSFDDYFAAFRNRLDELVAERAILPEERLVFCCRVRLGRAESKTYTQVYRDDYELFADSCREPPRNSCSGD